jgi:glycosyltransferase involved in cell wall biosynthesis
MGAEIKTTFLSKEINYSIIVPVFNEEDSVLPLFYSLKEIMDGLGEKYEIIFVDDGSTDSTLKRLNDLSMLYNNTLRVIHFNFNKGQGKAMEEGFRNAEGKIIISMDGDLQNDPKDIPELIFKIKKGFDLVCGWRHVRCDTFIKKIKSKLGNYLQRKIIGLSLHDISCTMRAYRKEAIASITFQEKFSFSMLPYIISQTKNIKMTEVKICHHHRKLGKTKYKCFNTIFGTVFCFVKLFCIYGRNRKVRK